MKFSRRRFFGAVAGAAMALASVYCPSLSVLSDSGRLDSVGMAYRDLGKTNLLMLMNDARRRCEFQPPLRWVEG